MSVFQSEKKTKILQELSVTSNKITIKATRKNLMKNIDAITTRRAVSEQKQKAMK